MNLFAIAFGLEDAWEQRIRAQVRALGRAIAQLDLDTFGEFGDAARGFAAWVQHPERALGRRRVVARRSGELVICEGVALDPGGVPLADAQTLAERWEELIPRLDGQFSAVRMRSEPASIEIANDFLGMRPLYFARAGRGGLVSNSATLLARLTGDAAFDALGVSSLLCWGWVSGDRTLTAGVRALPPGARWRWTEAAGLETRSSEPEARLASLPKRALSAERLHAMRKDLLRLTDALPAFGARLECGLTAGRDSRLIASLLRGSASTPSFITYAARESVEAQIAERVARALGVAHRVDPPPPAGIAEHWGAIAPTLALENDGLVELSQVGVLLNRQIRLRDLPVFIAGHGGEIARGFFIESPALVAPSRARSLGILKKRLVQRDTSLFRESVFTACEQHLESFEARMHDVGFEAVDVLDAFYTFERVGRWASSVGVRPSLPASEVFEPFCCRPFVDLAFSIPASERYRGAIHRAGVNAFAPELAEVPYEKGDSLTLQLARDLLRAVRPAIPARLRALASGGDGIAWLDSVLPQVRETCLDLPKSELWEWIDRGAFERLSAPGGDARERARSQLRLLRVATLFYYERVRESERGTQ